MAELLPVAVRDWNFPRGIASAALLVRFGAERGVSREALLRGTGLSPARLDDPAAQVDAHQELAVARNLVRELGNPPGLGLDAGVRYRVTTFGVFGFACISSPTLRDAIGFALRYLDLSFIFCLPVVELAEDELRFRLRDDGLPHDVRRFLLERDASAIHTVLHDLLPSGLHLRSVDFPFPGPPDPAGYAEVFGIHPGFDAPAHLVTLDPAALGQPLPQASEHTVALCEAQCRDLVSRRRARSGIAHQVRDKLIRVGGTVTMDEVALEFNISTRTLRRRLEDAGTSFRGLLDEVRQTLAEEMLATGALTVEDVALRLGYAEASSFIYAFRRWTGTTPARYLRSGTRH
ncbi:AraC family transcriptional regulator [Amycolatopsis granulosa]|uniref:AraC family transcriptional regulator n=1 Tax=Amycolatopsis granulosa TaxID=185684 RepID=UPI001422FFF3|nr:AraC family transcriptional regulator [Amycolatopsis granulosa]NIH83369.1 AraC-like DNA-binding protein [Amycolatopsis granulosa]